MYRLPETKKAGKPTDGTKTTTGAAGGGDDDDAPIARTRPDVMQKGVAMIGDLRTDATAPADTPIEDDTLLAMLILAFGGDNVSVDSGSDQRGDDRQATWSHAHRGGTDGRPRSATPGRAQDADRRTVLPGEPLAQVIFARIAGEAIGALRLRLPNMATEEFLSCSSRGALESVARAESVNIALAREGHAGVHGHALQGRHLRLSVFCSGRCSMSWPRWRSSSTAAPAGSVRWPETTVKAAKTRPTWGA